MKADTDGLWVALILAIGALLGVILMAAITLNAERIKDKVYSCEEDEVLVGVGDYEAFSTTQGGKWSAYICRPWDSLEDVRP